ncbi:hypothetical protein MRX96_032282 [Rhipicephalus microplus]
MAVWPFQRAISKPPLWLRAVASSKSRKLKLNAPLPLALDVRDVFPADPGYRTSRDERVTSYPGDTLLWKT